MYQVQRLKVDEVTETLEWVQVGKMWDTLEEATDAKEMLEALTFDDKFEVVSTKEDFDWDEVVEGEQVYEGTDVDVPYDYFS